MSQARRRQSDSPRWTLPAWLLPSASLLALTAALIATTLYWLPRVEGPAFETLVVKGERRQLTAEALRERVRPALEPGYFGADLTALRESLAEEPWVASVSVRRQWPSTLELTVHEEIPVAVWNREGFLNADGDFFVPREIHQPPGFLPELSGPEGTEAEVLEAWRSMRRTLAEAELEIEALRLSPRRAWSVTLEAGPEVQLGRRDQEARFDRFVRVALPALQQSERVRLVDLEYIDMRYTNGFSVALAGSESEERGNG